MEEFYKSFLVTHNGISYSTIIIFGAFIFLIILTLLGQGGRNTDVLRKSSFFSMMLLYIQAILGLLAAFTNPELQNIEGVSAYFEHFKYAICIFLTAGLITYVYLFLKKNTIVSTKIVAIALLAALIFEYAYPWRIIFGE